MGCIAVTTAFTRDGVHKMNNFDKRWIVDSPPELLEVAKRFIAENNGAGERTS
jgi:hypothetical protein